MRFIRNLALAALVAVGGGFAASPALASCSPTTLTVIDGAGATQATAADNCSAVIHPANAVEGADNTGALHIVSTDSAGVVQEKSANFPATVDTNSGAASASTLRVEPTSSFAQDAGEAKESGGNLAGAKTDLDTLVTHSPALNGDGGAQVHLTNGSSAYPADALTTGSINSATSNATFTVNLASGEGVVAWAVSGLSASGATLTLEGSNDGGTTWTAISELASPSSAPVSTLTADGQFRIGTGGRTKVRLRVSATGTGTVTVAANASTQAGVVSLVTTLPSGNKGQVGVDGWDAAEGAQADSACGTDNGTCDEIALLKRVNQRITSLIAALGSPLQAGGTTVLGAGSAVAGYVGGDGTAGSPSTHVVTAQGAGTAGSAAGGVQTVQGVASMTPFLVTPSATSSYGVGATGSAPPANAVYEGVNSGGNLVGAVGCNQHVFIHVTSATDTLLVQGVSSQTIKVCGVQYHFAGTAAQSVFLENTASTNANCTSTKTQISGLSTGNASSPTTDGFYNSTWGGLANTSGNGLCENSSGTGPVDVDLWYTQGS